MYSLSVKALNQFFGKKQILRNISFDLKKNNVTAFLGPNGAGKTTLLKTVMGLLPIDKKNIRSINLINTNISSNWSTSKRVENGLLYLPQQTSLFRKLTVLQNLKLVFLYHTYWTKQKNNKKKAWNTFKKEMDNWLIQTNLISCKKQIAGTLSGGQKRKLEVIRSILMHPKVIMLDEPFAGVDPKSIYELKKIFTDMARNDNIAILISDHNVDQVLSIADKIYVVINGQIVTSGGIKDIINNKATRKTYLGDQFYSEISNRLL